MTLEIVIDKYKTYDVCIKAVRNDGRAIKFVPYKHKDKNMYMQAFDNKYALKFIDDLLSEELYIEAIKRGASLESCKCQTPQICELAIDQNPCDLSYVMNQTYDLCMKAVRKRGWVLSYVRLNQTLEMCLSAVSNEGRVLEYVNDEFKTHKVCLTAVKNDGDAIQYVPIQTKKLCLEAVKNKPSAIEYIQNISTELFIYIFKNKHLSTVFELHTLKYRLDDLLGENNHGYDS